MSPNLIAKSQQRLRANRERSKAARSALVRRLAAMSPQALRQVNTKVWARLGPEGLAELVRQSKALARLELAPQRIQAPAGEKPEATTLAARMLARIRHWRAVEPLWWVAGTSFIKGGFVSVLLVLAVPAAVTVGQNIGWVEKTSYCHNLTRWTNDCLYIVNSGTMTPAQAAVLLDLSEDELNRANPQFFEPSQRLARSSVIRVPPRRLLDYFRWW